MKLAILLRRSRANRAAKTTKAGECCMGLLQAGFLCRLKNPFDGTNAKKGKTTLLPPLQRPPTKGRREGRGPNGPTLKGLGESAIRTDLESLNSHRISTRRSPGTGVPLCRIDT